MNLKDDIQAGCTVYFLGIGGIGMSALARYFHANRHPVMGYDLTPSPLTHELEEEGIMVKYEDSVDEEFLLSVEDTLVVRTPAVPEGNELYQYFLTNGFRILKRAEILGLVTRQHKALCVAGTHGKTTTSTLLAHLIQGTQKGTNAFLGGISLNYNSNLLLAPESEYVVVEADEYDRSFHHLSPYMSVITSIDPDHLDIYGDAKSYQQGFDQYAALVQKAVVVKKGFHVVPTGIPAGQGPTIYSYSTDDPTADFYAANIRVTEGEIRFDFHHPGGKIEDLKLGVPVWVNIENSVAALAIAWLNGVSDSILREGLQTFAGVKRRFNIHVSNARVAYMDDYAHHPTELQSAIESVRKIYPQRRNIGIFQPHLYSRTRDFIDGFARVLSRLDELILLPIYPARERPIPGVTSEWLMKCCRKVPGNQCRVSVVEKADLLTTIQKRLNEANEKGESLALMTLGAGDIDRFVPDITQLLQA